MASIALFVVGLCPAWAQAPLTPPMATGAGPLHVVSPDWRDQIIYFIVTDRFDDVDPRNNDQGADEFDPQQRNRFSGGDLKGIQRRLDYIQGLGATAIWVTPPVLNQWFDPTVDYGGYHGYWARDFTKVDPHFGTLADYQALSRALHGRGMYLVQDIVLNHVGNFFSYDQPPPAHDPTVGYRLNTASRPGSAPTQFPFSQNDPRRARDRRAGIYHWTPTITDYADRDQELNYQLSGLDDLNTESPTVRQALRQSYNFWIREAGVDAFRVDTAFYVPPDLMADFLRSADLRAPGVLQEAAKTGRHDFFVFGEGFGIDRAFDETMAKRIEQYMTDENGVAITPGMLNFPLYGALNDVFARGRPPSELAFRIGSMMRVHARPHLMPSFIDNHDVDRFLRGGSRPGLEQSLLAIMTLPGVPVIYYGTEQGFTEQRASMFATGWGANGRDHFDIANPLYRQIAAMAALRRANRVFSRGAPTVLRGQSAGPGAIAYLMRDGEETALVVFNSADRETLLDNLNTTLPAGARLTPLFGLTGQPPALHTDEKGVVTLTLPPRAGFVWRVEAGASSRGDQPFGSDKTTAFHIDPLPNIVTTASVNVTGVAAPNARFRLVLDADLTNAQWISADRNGAWSARVNVASLIDPTMWHTLTAWRPDDGRTSPTQSFQVQQDWRRVAYFVDPAGDDRGPPGAAYRYPSDPTFAARTMDVRTVVVDAAGGALRIDIEMAALSQIWNPKNGFDHVAPTIFITLPGEPGGAAMMPLQNAELPDGLRWHVRLRAHGWSNAAFSHIAATADNEGQALAPAPAISVDKDLRRIRFTIPAATLGNRSSLHGAHITIVTWDYDGGYRALSPEGGAFTMGGGQQDGEKIMDIVGPFSLCVAPCP